MRVLSPELPAHGTLADDRACCDQMRWHCEYQCAQHPSRCPDAIVSYSAMLDEFTIYGGGEWAIQFCPFCGTKLPQSRREEWFSKLEGLGVDPWRGQIPEEFRSDAWWRK